VSSIDEGSRQQGANGMPKDREHDLSSWIGRCRTVRARIHADRIAQMAATLDLPCTPRSGERLPAGWHWLFFNDAARRSELGADGHAKRGDFLPPVALPRRMWAGGRLRFIEPLRVDSEVERHSEITNVVSKRGRRGDLVFVTLRHRLSCEGRLALDEEQDIVYREAAAPGGVETASTALPAAAAHSEEVSPDPVLLFRYSALTFNGHRIHYDLRYATEEEGYPHLVVHGPLTATLLMGFAERRSGRTLVSFSFRGIAPLFVASPFHLQATADAHELWAKGPRGELAMTASAQF
jgi:3-methylfumaryl-CoA hydratase